jgi:hypothetical protein
MRFMVFVCAEETYNGSLGNALRQEIYQLLTVPTFGRFADIVVPDRILLGRCWHFRIFGGGVCEVELRKDSYKKRTLDENRYIGQSVLQFISASRILVSTSRRILLILWSVTFPESSKAAFLRFLRFLRFFAALININVMKNRAE